MGNGGTEGRPEGNEGNQEAEGLKPKPGSWFGEEECHRSEGSALVRRGRSSDLCGFEGAKARSCGEKPKEAGRPFDGRTGGKRRRGSRRQEHSTFPVTIA